METVEVCVAGVQIEVGLVLVRDDLVGLGIGVGVGSNGGVGGVGGAVQGGAPSGRGALPPCCTLLGGGKNIEILYTKYCCTLLRGEKNE